MKREAGRERERKRQTDEDQDCESMKQHYSKESQVKACTHTHREIKRQIHGSIMQQSSVVRGVKRERERERGRELRWVADRARH